MRREGAEGIEDTPTPDEFGVADTSGAVADPIATHGISDAFAVDASLVDPFRRGLSGGVPTARSLARYRVRRGTARAAMFDFACRHAPLRSLGGDFERPWRGVDGGPPTTGRFPGVLAGSRRLQEFLASGTRSGERLTAPVNS